ncbi:hypothetical protein VA7868_02819 [Vibrio aerogenes CECT 7868]|uniref:Uncharacterized protein n=1 Tax=Vibrio aerogenes CECT 7868 TaxID=1216006 RepID=A0A1M5ZJQ6_9VIBR|nr:hypothetical protein VA7868_02819 [Vibrio aerogenes CECT 7868]
MISGCLFLLFHQRVSDHTTGRDTLLILTIVVDALQADDYWRSRMFRLFQETGIK